MNLTNTTRLAATAALGGALVLAACSSSDPAAKPDAKATPYAASLSLSDVDLGSTIGVASDIPGLLPNHQFEILAGNYAPNSQTVIEGTPTAIEPAAATVWSRTDGDADQGTKVAFDDPEAESRTWIVTVRVDRTIAGSDPGKLLPEATEDGHVKVLLTSDGGKLDQRKYESGILGLGHSVWFLTAFDDQPKDAFGIAWFGGAVASVAKDGTLEFKLLPPQRRKEIHESSYGVDELTELAAAPVVRIPREK